MKSIFLATAIAVCSTSAYAHKWVSLVSGSDGIWYYSSDDFSIIQIQAKKFASAWFKIFILDGAQVELVQAVFDCDGGSLTISDSVDDQTNNYMNDIFRDGYEAHLKKYGDDSPASRVAHIACKQLKLGGTASTDPDVNVVHPGPAYEGSK